MDMMSVRLFITHSLYRIFCAINVKVFGIEMKKKLGRQQQSLLLAMAAEKVTEAEALYQFWSKICDCIQNARLGLVGFERTAFVLYVGLRV